MKTSNLLAQGKPTLSFKVFPPKTAASYESVSEAAIKIGLPHPDFMSVTYGAGGGTNAHTVSIASEITRQCGIPVLAHLTCVSSSVNKLNSR